MDNILLDLTVIHWLAFQKEDWAEFIYKLNMLLLPTPHCSWSRNIFRAQGMLVYHV